MSKKMSTQGFLAKIQKQEHCCGEWATLPLDEQHEAAQQQSGETPTQPKQHQHQQLAQRQRVQQQNQQPKSAKANIFTGTSEAARQANHILLLYHAKKCTHIADEHSQCPFNRHCAEMKLTWKHMAECTDNNCGFPHCYTSRVLLSHYRRCKDARCPVCGPVRKTIQQNRRIASRPVKETIHHNYAMQNHNCTMQTPPFIHEKWRKKERPVHSRMLRMKKRFTMDTDTLISEIEEIEEDVEKLTIEGASR